MSELTMPSFGADMENGVLSEWLVQPGDSVNKGDIVAVIETQKGAIDMEVFQSGVIRTLLVEPGTRIPVGAAIADIDEGALQTPVILAAPPTASGKESPSQSAPRIKASPLARRLAERSAIPLSTLRGSGPQGAIIAADINTANTTNADIPIDVPATRPETLPVNVPLSTSQTGELSGMRQAIAAAMARSKREIPHYYLGTTIELQEASQWMEDYNRGKKPDQQLLLTALLHKAVALALASSPELNGYFIDGQLQLTTNIHLGMTISIRGGGLISPALHHADRDSLPELMNKMRDLTLRARRGGLRSSEMSDATITVTGMGDRGVETLYGVIYPPQVAIIGLGKPALRPWVVDGEVQPRLLINVSLAADHRVSDGRQGAKFLRTLNKLLQQPKLL
ncbi:MAG: dihydrolipoamide acetyltransferase family protein [Amphritea sp.]